MDLFERLAARIEPRLRRGFREAVDSIRSVSFTALMDAIGRKNVEEVLDLLGLTPSRWEPLRRAFYVGYETAGLDIQVSINKARSQASAAYMFNTQPPQRVADYTTNLIREINEDQRRMVSERLAPLTSGVDQMLTGETPQKLALDLVGRVNKATGKREGGIIGLTSSQAKWGANYEIELDGVPDPNALTRALRDKRFDKTIRKAIREDRPLDPEVREAAINAYRNRSLRYRAENIAGNEAHAVVIQAQQEAWRQAIEEGRFTSDEVRRFWVTREDLRVRPNHAKVPGMNPKGVGIDEPFATPLGPAMHPGWSFEPGCRCRTIYRLIED